MGAGEGGEVAGLLWDGDNPEENAGQRISVRGRGISSIHPSVLV